MNLKSLPALQVPDFGQTIYVVDSDLRTQAQGWTRGDRTGPLDLYLERNPGYVFRTGDFSRDQLALQAAVDEAIDYRNDKVLLTPGSYSIATAALALDAIGLRLSGVPVRNPRRSQVIVTDALGDGLAVSVDDVEIGHMRMVPITANNILDLANGADGGYIHDVWYDTTGVTASTSTEFVRAAATTSDWLVENCYFLVSGLQGDCFTWTTATRWIVQNSIFCTMTASYATVFTLATACVGNIVRGNIFTADIDGTYTNIFTGQADSDGQLLAYGNIVNGTALATATAIETGFGTTQDIELAENYQTGDATTQGGTLITLA